MTQALEAMKIIAGHEIGAVAQLDELDKLIKSRRRKGESDGSISPELFEALEAYYRAYITLNGARKTLTETLTGAWTLTETTWT